MQQCYNNIKARFIVSVLVHVYFKSNCNKKLNDISDARIHVHVLADLSLCKKCIVLRAGEGGITPSIIRLLQPLMCTVMWRGALV